SSASDDDVCGHTARLREQLKNPTASVGKSRAAGRRRSELRRSFLGERRRRLRTHCAIARAVEKPNCERRKIARRRTEEERAEAFFPRRATTTSADTLRDCASS